MLKHVQIHRGGYNQGAATAEVNGEQEIISGPRDHATQGLCGCWCDEEYICPESQLNVVGP